MTDRFKDLDPIEQRIASLRRDGYLVVDVHGRPRVPLGEGPESQLARATHPVRKRNAARISHGIGTKDFKSLFTATATANLAGFVLNEFVTIAWRVAPHCSESFAARCHDELLDLMRAWFRDRRRAEPDLPFAAIWVKEVGRSLGLHSHFLVHVPHDLRFDFRRWVDRAAHKLVEAPRLNPFELVDTGRLVHVSPNFDRDTREQWNVFKYLMKGIEPDALLTLRLEQTHVKHLVREFAGVPIARQGAVVGKRTGFTRAIGPSALEEIAGQFAVPAIWPERSLQGDKLAYDDRFLRAGELGRHLAALPEI